MKWSGSAFDHVRRGGVGFDPTQVPIWVLLAGYSSQRGQHVMESLIVHQTVAALRWCGSRSRGGNKRWRFVLLRKGVDVFRLTEGFSKKCILSEKCAGWWWCWKDSSSEPETHKKNLYLRFCIHRKVQLCWWDSTRHFGNISSFTSTYQDPSQLVIHGWSWCVLLLSLWSTHPIKRAKPTVCTSQYNLTSLLAPTEVVNPKKETHHYFKKAVIYQKSYFSAHHSQTRGNIAWASIWGSRKVFVGPIGEPITEWVFILVRQNVTKCYRVCDCFCKTEL